VSASLPEPLTALIEALSRLPGIGPRSAERIALHLVLGDPGEAHHLAQALTAARDSVKPCPECGALTDREPCALCTDPRRDATLLCVVEQAVDVITMERAGAFLGRYHVLGGRLSPVQGVGPEDLRIAELERRLASGAVGELILALGTDVEGEATGFYLARRLSRPALKITRLAYGLPVGSGLDFADDLTLNRALQGRAALE